MPVYTATLPPGRQNALACFGIVDDGELPLVVRLVRRRRDALADLLHRLR